MRSKTLLAGIVAMAIFSVGLAEESLKDAPPSLAFSMKSLEGENVDLSKYEGKVVLFVNVASNCGYTKQYTGLQKLHQTYAEKGLAVIGVPCNQFGGQEPGTNKEIKQFCSSKYNVTFDMHEKVNVNGTDACWLYKYLTGVDTKPASSIHWIWSSQLFLL